MNHNISQEIERVIDTLTRYGWIQHNYGHPEVGFCIAGAYMHGVAADHDSLNEFADALFGKPWEGEITFWNDRTGRTFEDVILHLKEAQHRLQES